MAKVLTLNEISKQYGSGRTAVQALTDVHLALEEGEFVGVVGPSGSGKSTFLAIAAGLEEPSTGSVKIGETKLATLSEKERVRLRFSDIGFILQQSNLVPFLKVQEQFELIEKIERKLKNPERKQQLMEALAIADLEGKYPQELSGGERQRVAIACALYHQPRIIVADEPTASLDTKRAFDVAAILAREAKEQKTAILMVTHDERLLKYCDRVVRIRDGVLTEEKASSE